MFKPIGTLRSKLVKVNDKMLREKLSNLVNGIPCGSQRCAATYVSETKQSLRARLDQHRHKGFNEAQISAVYLHCKETRHSFNTDVVILDREEDWVRRGIKEAWSSLHLTAKGDSVSICPTHGTGYGGAFLVACHVIRPGHVTFSISWWRPWFISEILFQSNISSMRFNSSTFKKKRLMVSMVDV